MSIRDRILDQLKYGQTLFYLAFCLYLYKQGMETTMFSYNYVFSKYSQILIILLLVIKILLYDHCTPKQMVISIAMTALTVIVAVSSKHMELVMWVLLVLGARNVPVEKILKIYLLITGSIVMVAFCASQLGIIVNLVYKSAEGARNAFGIVYPTDLAAHVFGLIIVWLYLHRGRVKSVQVGVIALFTGILFWFCRTKLDCICILLAVCMFCLIQWVSRKYSSIARITAYRPFRRKYFQLLQQSIFPVFMLFSLCATWLYNGNGKLLSGNFPSLEARLVLGKRGLQNMGVKIFGQAVNMVGAGGGTDFRPDYNFIDCSYLNILIQYGPLFLFMVLAVLVLVCKKYGEDRYLTAVMFCWGLNAVVAHHLVEITYNPFSLLLLAGDAVKEDKKVADYIEKLKNSYHRWQDTVRKHQTPQDLQCIQNMAFLIMVVSACFPEIMVNEQYDLSRTFWKCLFADGAAVFLIASGMQLYHEKSYKVLLMKTINGLFLPLCGVGLISWFFSRWFAGGWDFWWSLWHVKEDWTGFLSNLLQLKNPYYYMEYTGFLYAYFLFVILFPLWKKGLEIIRKKTAYRAGVLCIISCLFLVNDYKDNIIGLSEEGWHAILPVVLFVTMGAVLEMYRERCGQIRKPKITASMAVIAFLLINVLRCMVQYGYVYPEKASNVLLHWFSVAGLYSAIALIFLLISLQTLYVRYKKTNMHVKIQSCFRQDYGYMVYLLQGMIIGILIKNNALEWLLEYLLIRRGEGCLWELFYTGTVFIVLFILTQIVYEIGGWIWKRMGTKTML